MAKTDSPPMYSCMASTSDLRRVQEPHDERVAVTDTQHRLRRALAKLVAAVRAKPSTR
jgi:hypothetical protein